MCQLAKGTDTKMQLSHGIQRVIPEQLHRQNVETKSYDKLPNNTYTAVYRDIKP